MAHPVTLSALLLGGLVLGTAACDVFSGEGLNRGQSLKVTEYADRQPASRTEYTALATFILPGRVAFVRPGTGPDDLPELVRTLDIPDVVTWDAQIDRDGYVWVATPDAAGGGSIREMYVVDPHAAKVHRVIEFPDELRAPANVLVGPDAVYVQAWRSGQTGGIGRIDRACPLSGACRATLLTELDSVGPSGNQSLRLLNGDLYSFRSGDRPVGALRIDLPSGEVVAQWMSFRAGTNATDGRSFYVVGYFEPGVNSIARLDAETLAETARVGIASDSDDRMSLVAVEDGALYLGGYRSRYIDVRSAETLERVRTIDISSASRASSNNFGFIAPGLLLINMLDVVDVRTGEVYAGVLPERAFDAQALRFPEGHPRAD